MPLIPDDYPGGETMLRRVLEEGRLERTLKTRKYFLVGRQPIGDNAVLFKFARTRKVNTVDFDGDNFYKVAHPDHPFVHVLFDLKLQICAIERNSNFASDVDWSAQALAKLLAESHAVKRYDCEVTFDAIRDPTELIEYVRKASQIINVFFDVRRVNVFDPSDFVPALKKLNQEADAIKSRTSLDGAHIKNDVAEGLIRVSASTGEDAGATFRMVGHRDFTKKSLGRSFISVSWPEDISETASQLLSAVKEAFRKVRRDIDAQ